MCTAKTMHGRNIYLASAIHVSTYNNVFCAKLFIMQPDTNDGTHALSVYGVSPARDTNSDLCVMLNNLPKSAIGSRYTNRLHTREYDQEVNTLRHIAEAEVAAAIRGKTARGS